MAKIFLARAFTIATFSAASLHGCDMKSSPQVDIVAGVAQGGCGPAEVYHSPTDKCRLASEIKELVTTTSFIPAVTSPPPLRSTIVVRMVTLQKGDGCISATRGTEKPLSLNDCIRLSRKYNRDVIQSNATRKGGVIQAPILSVGEQMALYKNEKGELEWILHKK